MTTAQQYRVISDKAYSADLQKKKSIKTGNEFKAGGTTYKVLKTTDNNENGMQAIAVAPLKGDKPDTSHITIAYAGTDSGDPKDIAADIQGFAAGKRNTTILATGQHTTAATASQFKTASTFAKNVEATYPKAAIDFTGHSLGGGLANFVAVQQHKPGTVFAAADPWKALNKQERLWALMHPEMVTNYIHNDDNIVGLTNSALGTTNRSSAYRFAATKTSKNSNWMHHMLDSFEFDQDGKVRLWDAADSSASFATQADTYVGISKNRLAAFKEVVGGYGNLTAGEKVFMDTVQANLLAMGLLELVTAAMAELYQTIKANQAAISEHWTRVHQHSQSIGSDLSEAEVLDAMATGWFTKAADRDRPIAEYDDAAKQLTAIEDDLTDLSHKMTALVAKRVEEDTDDKGLFE